MNNIRKQTGQISLDLLLSIVIFLVVIGILMGYVNNFESSIKEYSSNLSGYGNYIVAYDEIKSLDFMSGFNYKVYFGDINFDYSNKTIILDINNNYIIGISNFNCNLTEKWCGK